MNYKEVVDRIKKVIKDHKMVNDYGYGDLSDIKVLNEDGSAEADYPYVFINPAGLSRNRSAVTYAFNLIAMDMDAEDIRLQVQSDCIQYLDDIVGRLRYFYDDQVQLSYTTTVFNERFQDNVAGATANIQIIVNEGINSCDLPIFEEIELVSTFTNDLEYMDNDFHQALSKTRDEINFPEYDAQFDRLAFWFDIVDPYDYGGHRSPNIVNGNVAEGTIQWVYGDRELKIPASVTGRLKIAIDLELTNVQGVDFTDDYIRLFDIGGEGEIEQIPVPELPLDGTPVSFSYEFEFDAPDYENQLQFIWQYRDQGTQSPNGPLIGYRGTLKVIEIR